MPKLWLVQYLCPERHAICALAYDVEHTSPDEAESKIRATLLVAGFNPWCGLCGSRDLRMEHRKLSTDDWDEATRILRAQEQANLATRDFFLRSRN